MRFSKFEHLLSSGSEATGGIMPTCPCAANQPVLAAFIAASRMWSIFPAMCE